MYKYISEFEYLKFVLKFYYFCFFHTSWAPNENQINRTLNIGRKSMFLMPEKDSHFSFPVEQLVFILNKEVVKTIIQIEKDEDDIISNLKDISEHNLDLKNG